MAETLKPEEKFLKSVTTVKLKDRPIFKGSVDVLKGIGYDISTLVGASRERESVSLFVEKEGLLKNLQGELKNIALLDDLAWNSLSNSDKKVVLALVKDIQELSGIDVGADHIQDDAKAVLTKCMEVVDKVGEQVKSIASMGSFSHSSLKDLLTQMDKGNIEYYHTGAGILVPSKEDLDIVTALKMTGIDLQFDGTKWELNTASSEKGAVSFAPTKDGKPLQVFGNDNIKFLLNNYLNVPQGQRQQTVVPSKLLQVYVNEYERQMMDGKDPSSLETGIIRQDVARQKNIFSMDSNEFQITKLLDRDTIMRNAQKMAMVNAFEGIVKGAKDTGEISDSISDTIEIMSTDPAYRDIVKGLNKLVPMLDRVGDKFEDATEFEGGYNVDFVAEYDRQIEYLKRTNANVSYIDALTQAKNAFIETATIQQVYWQSKLVELSADNQGNIFSAGLVGAINESMGFAVMQNDGGDFVMANGETIKKFLESKNSSETVYEQLKNRAQNRTASGSEHTTSTVGQQTGTKVTGYPEIFFEYAGFVQGVDFSAGSNFVLDYSNLRLYESMWQEGCFFDLDFTAFKQDKPSATLEEYVQHFASGQAPELNFDPALVADSYYLVHPKEAQTEQLNKVQTRIENFNKQLLITDLMLGTFTPDDLMQYDTMVDGVKTAFLNKKYQQAIKDLEELEKDTVGYQEALEKAKKRHEAGIVGSVIQQKWSEASVADNEKGQGPLISSAVDAFLNSCANTQQENNKELAQNGEPIIDNGEPEAEKQEVKNEKPTTFGDMFPSGPNVNKFLKKMKPYHPKEIIKHFIEPLLEAIDGIIIDMPNYYAKVATVSNKDFTNNVVERTTPVKTQATPEPENKPKTTESPVVEEQVQRQEQQLIAVKQRDFEASSFIPAAIMFDRVRGRSKGKPEFEQATKLQQVFRYMATTGEIEGSEKLGVATPDGKDVRDELRGLALRVCGGEFKTTGSDGVLQTLSPILTKYGVDTQVQEDIKDAFLFMTPELLAIALEPVSVVRDNKTMEIGAKLPHHMINAQTDRERWISLQTRGFNVAEHEGTIEDLSTLVGTIYRTRDNSQIDKVDIDRAFNVELEHKDAKFNQVKDTDQMMALLKEMRERSGMQQNSAELEEDVLENGL